MSQPSIGSPRAPTPAAVPAQFGQARFALRLPQVEDDGFADEVLSVLSGLRAERTTVTRGPGGRSPKSRRPTSVSRGPGAAGVDVVRGPRDAMAVSRTDYEALDDDGVVRDARMVDFGFGSVPDGAAGAAGFDSRAMLDEAWDNEEEAEDDDGGAAVFYVPDEDDDDVDADEGRAGGAADDWRGYEEGADFTDEWESLPGPGERSRRGESRSSVSIEVRAFDSAIVSVKAGDGGNGCVAFRREKYVEFGGPAGGNGGRGGSVWVVADPGRGSLLHFRRQVHWRAGDGGAGSGFNKTGAGGGDVEIPVPLGTVVRRRGDPDDAPPLAEILAEGDRALVAAGGRGGRGNASFKSNRNRAPLIAEKGERGQELWLALEMKVGGGGWVVMK